MHVRCFQVPYSTNAKRLSSRYDITLPTLAKLPEYLRVHNYKNPQEYSKSPMQWAVGESQFEWLAKNKYHQTLFNSYMSSRREGKPVWFDVYSVERLLDGATSSCPEAVFLVDIGGNQGHDLIKFHTRYPAVPGRLILQDLPTIVSGAQKHPGIETIGYSFLDPQPIKRKFLGILRRRHNTLYSVRG